MPQESSEGRTGKVFPVRLSDAERALLNDAAALKYGGGKGRASPAGRFVRFAIERAAVEVLGQGAALQAPTRTRKPRAQRRATCPTDRAECAYTVEGARCTVAAPLRVPARGGAMGTDAIPARYCLVEIDRLLTSHQPLRGFAPMPGYPPDAQERDYRRDDERAKVEEIAKSYDPALVFNTGPGAIDGVPVATEGRILLGGNGRTMATALVYAGRGGVAETAPRDYLIEHGREFGITKRQVERFRHPMLVRTVRVDEAPRSLAEWSRRLNVSLSQQLDATALAVSRARFLDDAALDELRGMAESETLADFLSSTRSRSFVRALQRAGVIDGRAAAVYLGGDGLLNERGRELVSDLLVAVLVPDADLIRAYGRGPISTLARGAPALLTVAQAGAYDLRPALRRAVRDRITMRAQRFERVADYLRQQGLFGASAAVGDDAAAVLLLYVLAALEGSPLRFARFARYYAEQARAGASGQGALFAAETVSQLDALRLAAEEGAGVKLPRE